MNSLDLFAGAGLGILGTHHLLGWRSVGYVEMAEYPCKVLEARIKDGLLSPAPIFQMHTGDFIRLGLPERYRGVAQVVTAGFPCQPFSLSGQMAAGNDERNGWPDTLCIIGIVRPEWVFLENVPGLLAGSHGYYGTILKDLAQSGYDVCWRVLSAAEVGAPHKRDRVWIVAHTSVECQREPANEADSIAACRETRDEFGDSGQHLPHANSFGGDERAGALRQAGRIEFKNGGQSLADTDSQRQQQPQGGECQERGRTGDGDQMANTSSKREWQHSATGEPERSKYPSVQSSWWESESGLGRVVNGCPSRVDRLRAIGNGQVPAVVATVWRLLAQQKG